MTSALPPLHGELDDGAFRYVPVPVPELREAWPLLQYGLEVVRKSNGEPWIAEDVYCALLYSRAQLYLIERNDEAGELVGFAIFETMNFPYEFKPRLNVWIGWAKYPAHGYLGVEVARRVARAAGIDSIVFSTSQENSWTAKFKKLHTWYEV